MDEDIDYNLKMNKESFTKEVVSWILTFVACIICAKLITSFIIVNARVPSASMENTVMTNDRLIANRLAYTFSDPERFDVIVFVAPDEPDKLFIKRIIGIPGDTVEIDDGQLIINGEVIENEEYIKEPMSTDETLNGNYGPVTVPEGNYFMLGDNRNNSWDSRYWINTFVPEDTILGEAMFTYYPKIHWID